VVAALFVVLMASSGLGFYSLPIFVRVMSEEGAFSVHTVSTASAIFFATSGLTGLAVARALARMDVRWVVTAGGLLGALCLLALGRVGDRTALYLVYALFGVGFSATSLIPAMTVVARWFERQRAIAVGVVSTGLSFGGVIVAPLAASLAERHGLSVVTPWLACGYLAGTIPLTWAFVRDGPNGRLHGPAGTTASVPGVSYRAAVRGQFFLWFSIAYVFLMGAQVGAMIHVYNLASLRIDSGFGQLVVALIAISSICGRFGGGFLLTRVSVYPMASVLCAVQALTLASLSLSHTGLAIGIATVGFGLSVGNLLMMQPLIVIDAFGVRDYAKIYALTQLVTTLGYAVGPGLMGRMFDSTGNYRAAFFGAAVAAAAGFVCFRLAVSRRPRKDLSEPFVGGRLGS
jgi:predicted MFS family arabinose efflux permease